MTPLSRIQILTGFLGSVSLLCVFTAGSSMAQGASTAQSENSSSFPTESQYVDKTGSPIATPNSRQLTNPESGRSTFNGFNRQLTNPTTGQSTFHGYSIKLTDPQTGASTFKGYGQNPLMQNRQSAPDFHWNSNVDSAGKSQYSGFGRAPLTTSDGRSTFIGNNRKLTGETGASTFVGNNRQLADPGAREDFLKQTPNIRPIQGRQSNINLHSFPDGSNVAPNAVSHGEDQRMVAPALSDGKSTVQSEVDSANQSAASQNDQDDLSSMNSKDGDSGAGESKESGF